MNRTLQAGPVELRRVPEGFTPRPYVRCRVVPLTPVIGAEIAGVDLREPLDDELCAELEQALLEWKVIFFRDQAIDGAQHRAFARRWGELEVHPFLPQGEVAEVVRFAKDAASRGYENVWHSDVSWREVPSLGSVLRCIETPPCGGDTLWADMACAYDALPAELRERIDGLVAVHDFTSTFGQLMSDEQRAEMRAQYPPAEHPLVRRHPATGRKTLYVNAAFTSHVVGIPEEESEALLQLLFRQAQIPELQCRFRWTKDAIAFWDNRATQHYAASDYFPQRRVMERATIIGDRPR
jgi:taurine dioxygenase